MNDPSEPPRKRSRRSTSDESAELQALRAALAAKDDELKVLATENAALRESQSLSQPLYGVPNSVEGVRFGRRHLGAGRTPQLPETVGQFSRSPVCRLWTRCQQWQCQ